MERLKRNAGALLHFPADSLRCVVVSVGLCRARAIPDSDLGKTPRIDREVSAY